MSVIVFSVFLCISGCFHGSLADIQNIIKKPGENVTLMCEDPEYKKIISLLEWSREDSEILFVFRGGQPSPLDQHESFKNRVFLKDSQMKDGDLSVVLKNVTMKDSGTYECRVQHKNDPSGAPPNLISTIRLSVVPPGDPSPGDPSPGDPSPGDPSPGDPSPGDPSPGNTGGLIAGGIIGIVLAALAAVVVLWIYKKKFRCFSGTSELSDKQMDDL